MDINVMFSVEEGNNEYFIEITSHILKRTKSNNQAQVCK